MQLNHFPQVTSINARKGDPLRDAGTVPRLPRSDWDSLVAHFAELRKVLDNLWSFCQDRSHVAVGCDMVQGIIGYQADDEDNSAPFIFRAAKNVLVMRDPVAEVPKRGQRVVESISIDARWECFVKMGNPDGFS